MSEMSGSHDTDAPRLSTWDRRVVAYANWIMRNRWKVLVGAALVSLVLLAQLRNIVFNGDYAVFFSEDDPKVHAYADVVRSYSNTASIFFVVTAKDGDLFTPDALRAIQHITEKAWNLPLMVRVDSITNYPYARWENDKLVISPIVDDPASMSLEELTEAKRLTLDQKQLADRIINPDASVTGVNVQVSGKTDEQIAMVRALRDETLAKYPGVEIRLTGVVMLNNGFKEATIQDLGTMTPIMLIILVGSMALLLRSFLLTFITFTVIALSTFTAGGIAVMMGYEMSGPVAPAPIMIMTLSVANCVHILITMLWYMRHGDSRDEAIVESIRLNAGPVLLTSLTTCIGFLSMTLNAVPPIKTMAVVTALGVLMALAYSLTYLPAILAVLPIRAAAIKPGEERVPLMEALAEWVIRYRGRLVAGSVGTTAVLAAFIPTIEFNNQFVDFLKERVEIRQDTDYAAEHLSGIFQVVWSIDSGEAGGIANPEYLHNLDAFGDWLRQQNGVTHVSSITETVKRINQLTARGDEAQYRLPETQNQATTALKLYEKSLPKGLSLRTQVTRDWDASLLIATTDNMRSKEMRALADRSYAWMNANMPETMVAEAMGPWILFAHISDVMRRSMVISTPLALVLVSFSLIFALRSLKFGLISLVPNLLPLGAAFGLWGLLGWDMDMAMTGVMAMSIGIVVDDTVHFMSKYLRARREKNMSSEDAVRYAFASVGKALTITSFVLIAGFITLTASMFTTSVNMGLLSAMVITFALAGDLLFLPALLITLDRGRAHRQSA
jgi:uncharacterized protein